MWWNVVSGIVLTPKECIVAPCYIASQLQSNAHTSVLVDCHNHIIVTWSLLIAYCMPRGSTPPVPTHNTYITISFNSVSLPNMCATITDLTWCGHDVPILDSLSHI